MGQARDAGKASVEPGENAGERAQKSGRVVGENGEAEAREALRIAVGAERERAALRPEPLDDMREHRLAAECDEPLVRAAHAPREPAVEDEAERRLLFEAHLSFTPAFCWPFLYLGARPLE